MSRYLLLCSIGHLGLFAGLASAATLNPGGTQSELFVRASQGGGVSPFAESRQDPSSLPFVSSDSVQQSASVSTANYSLGVSALEVYVDQARAEADAAVSRAWGDVYFSTGSLSTYTLSGAYGMESVAGGLLTYEVWLYDETQGATVFFNIQDSIATPHESFVLGEEEGDRTNQLVGGLTGALNPGHIYRLSYIYELRRYPSPGDSGATASGFVSLSIVPEPGVGAFLVFVLFAVLVQNLRQDAGPHEQPTPDGQGVAP